MSKQLNKEDLLFDLSQPWISLPKVTEDLRRIGLDHQFRTEDCGDHTIEVCSCGENRNRSLTESRRHANGDFGPDPHSWDWERHFAEEWNKVIEELFR